MKMHGGPPRVRREENEGEKRMAVTIDRDKAASIVTSAIITGVTTAALNRLLNKDGKS
jgi:hypothetical protein